MTMENSPSAGDSILIFCSSILRDLGAARAVALYLSKQRTRVNRADIARALAETGLLPGIVFIFSRNGCDRAVRQCLREGVRLTSAEERREIRQVVTQSLSQVADHDLRVLGYSEWLSGLERGIAAHHAGLLLSSNPSSNSSSNAAS